MTGFLCGLFGMGLLMVLIITFSKTANYYFKLAFIIGATSFVSGLTIPLMLLKPFHHTNALIPAKACLSFLKMCGATFTVLGRENIVKENGGIVLLNHQSVLDVALSAFLWPILGRVAIVAKREFLFIFPFGLALYFWGTIFIDRKKSTEARDTLNKEYDAIANGKKKLIFFPEGTRHGGETLLPFKKGPFCIAIQTQCPIQPVVCSRYHFLDAKTPMFGRGTSIVKILPEIPTKGLTKDDLPMLMEKLQKIMQNEYDIVSNESAVANKIKSS